MKKIAAGWRCVTNYDGNRNGMLWVMWDPNNV